MGDPNNLTKCNYIKFQHGHLTKQKEASPLGHEEYRELKSQTKLGKETQMGRVKDKKKPGLPN